MFLGRWWILIALVLRFQQYKEWKTIFLILRDMRKLVCLVVPKSRWMGECQICKLQFQTNKENYKFNNLEVIISFCGYSILWAGSFVRVCGATYMVVQINKCDLKVWKFCACKQFWEIFLIIGVIMIFSFFKVWDNLCRTHYIHVSSRLINTLKY